MKNLVIATILSLFLFTGCASDYRYTGAATGAGVGGTIGALAMESNSWLGLVIGATAGGLLGYITGDAMQREREAQSRAVNTGQRVTYYDDQQRAVDAQPVGRRYYYTDDRGNPTKTNCQKVRTKVWNGDKVVSDKTEEVCTGSKSTNTY